MSLLVDLGVRGAVAAIDPISADHPIWFAPRIEVGAEPKIDGVVDAAEWRGAFELVRTQAWRRGQVRLNILYGDQGLYLAVQADDRQLWADGMGGGNGNRWEVESDDSITFYFDPNDSRDEYLQADDRVFGVNIGNGIDPLNGDGPVRRWKYIRGDGSGGAPDVLPAGVPAAGIRWASALQGTVNDASDLDTGWSTEVFLPWPAIGMTTPGHGDVIGVNFDLIFDNDGGGRNFVGNGDGPDRFVLPAFVDDHLQGAHSSYTDSGAGIHGPVNYAELMFVDAAAGKAPAAIGPITAGHGSAFGELLQFTAPAGSGTGKGHAAGYEIRVSTAPIGDESAWATATPIPNRYVPRSAGRSERLRIQGLEPSTLYHVYVRARDYFGRLGPIGPGAVFTTASRNGGADRGRIVPAQNGSGLVFEDGTPFVPVGEHLGMSWGYFRNLYAGDIWEPASRKFIDYHAHPSLEGPAGPHLDAMQAHGVNTLRVFLEILATDQTGNSERPRGRYWLEFPRGQFNPDMKQFILTVLEEAASRGMYLIFSPFDTFTWDDVFREETPWYRGNGGPLGSIDEFFQDPNTLDQAKQRMDRLIAWVNESPYKDHLIGWEPLNEWDSTEWTKNPEGDGEPGRETELRRRAQWIHALNSYIREQDPDHLIISSTTYRDPRGPVARAVFYDRSVDVLAPHFYTNSSEEPHNNPQTYKEVMPAEENALLGNYWSSHRIDQRPLLNSEWGFTFSKWPNQTPAYGSAFSQAQDEALFRTMSWSGLATGQAGEGLRITGPALEFNLNSLTDGMREVQRKLAALSTHSPLMADWGDFAAHTLEGEMQAICRNNPSADPVVVHDLKAFGSHDAHRRGVLYVLLDRNTRDAAACPFPAEGWLELGGFPNGQQYYAETWATSGAETAPISTQSAFSFGGQLKLALDGIGDAPASSTDLFLLFRRGPAPAEAGSLPTPGAPLDIGIDPGSGAGAVDAPVDSTCHSVQPPCDFHYRFVSPGSGQVLVTLTNLDGCFRIYSASGVTLAQSEHSAADHCNGGAGDDSAGFQAIAGEEYFILVEAPDGTGHHVAIAGPAAEAMDNNPLASTPGGYVNAAAADNGTVVATTLNAERRLVVFIDEHDHSDWSARVLAAAPSNPVPTGMPVAFVDPKDNGIYVAYPSDSGLMLYHRMPDGGWALTNLSTQVGSGADPIVGRLAYFISPPDGIPAADTNLIGLVGLNRSNQLVQYVQHRQGGEVVWLYTNISVDYIEAMGQVPPGWVGRIHGYATPWNGQNIAGLDAFGQIIAVWTAPDLDGTWFATNLSKEYGTPPLQGEISPYVNWGINLAGVLPNGDLGVTWWSAQYESEQRSKGLNKFWAFSNLTEVTREIGGPKLKADSIAGVSTPNWPGITVYGLTQEGKLVSYWWAPDQRARFGREWFVDDLNARLTGSQRPVGRLTALAAKDSNTSVFGVAERGDVLRFFWLQATDTWRFENLSTSASR